MKTTLKTLTLITTGLVVGVVVGRVGKKKTQPTVTVKIADLPEYKRTINELKSKISSHI